MFDNNNKITITEENGNVITSLNVIADSMGEKKINICKLQEYGYFIIDHGLKSTAFCESKITYINGTKGTLLYRGFPIDQLAQKATYLEVCYILLYGDTPTYKEYKNFCNLIAEHSNIDRKIEYILYSFHKNVHPMIIMSTIVNSLSSFCSDLDFSIEKHRNIVACQLIAKMPIIAAICYKHLKEEKFILPKNNYSYSMNLLHMFTFKRNKKNNIEDSNINLILEKAMNCILILHADHEQNVSTSAVRIVGSSGTNPFSCIAAAISSLSGILHGGANEACLQMLKMINKIENIPKFIKKAKNKKDPFKLMGFGHRIYKNYDPRADVMRKTCYEIFKKITVSDKLLNLLSVAVELENVALRDQYFIERKLYPNIDFYSGLILKAIGIPSTMFTAIFAIARTVGWVAHWREMYENEHGLKLIRPRQLYKGHKPRKFISQISL